MTASTTGSRPNRPPPATHSRFSSQSADPPPARRSPGPPASAGHPVMPRAAGGGARCSELRPAIPVARGVPARIALLRTGSGGARMEGASGEQLCHAVSQCVPHLNLSAKELASHPKFSRLLLSLTDRLDRTGLSLSLKRDLERASGGLRTSRRQWLAAEVLDRTVEELVAEQHAAHAEKAPSREDQQFLETLEQCWVLGRCRRGLDMRAELTEDPQPPLLGLGKEHLNELRPGTKEVLAMRRRLMTEVEQRLVRQCVELLTYVWPQYDGESPGVLLARGGELVAWIQAEQLRVDGLMQQEQLNQAAIGRQTVACLTVLIRCYELLRTLTEAHRLDSQPLLDQSLLEYLKMKRQMMFSKLRLLRLEVHHEMFNKDVVGAHRTIRELLQEALSAQEARLSPMMGQLDLFRQLGPEFEDLVKEYNQLLGRLEHKQWALSNFSETLGNGGSG